MRRQIHLDVIPNRTIAGPTIATEKSAAIDCATCPMVAGPVCADCVMSAIVGPPPAAMTADLGAGPVAAHGGDAGAVVIDVAEARALRLLERAGMLGEVVERRPVPQRSSMRSLGRSA